MDSEARHSTRLVVLRAFAYVFIRCRWVPGCFLFISQAPAAAVTAAAKCVVATATNSPEPTPGVQLAPLLQPLIPVALLPPLPPALPPMPLPPPACRCAAALQFLSQLVLPSYPRMPLFRLCLLISVYVFSAAISVIATIAHCASPAGSSLPRNLGLCDHRELHAHDAAANAATRDAPRSLGGGAAAATLALPHRPEESIAST